jgi:hypothetical protein
MSRHFVTVLIFSLTLLAGACSSQSAFEPSQPTVTGFDERPSFNGGRGDDAEPKKSPGGSRGGWK